MTLNIKDIAQKHLYIQTGEHYHNASLSDFLQQNTTFKEEYLNFIENKLIPYQKEIDAYNQFVNYLINIDDIRIDKINIVNIEKDHDNNLFVNVGISDDPKFLFSFIFSKSKSSYYGEESKIRLFNSFLSLKTSYSGSMSEIELFMEKNSFKESDITRNLIKSFLDTLQYNHDIKNQIIQIKDIGRTLFKIFNHEIFSKKIPLDLLLEENLMKISSEKIDIIGLEKDIDLKNNINNLILKVNEYNSTIKTINKKNKY